MFLGPIIEKKMAPFPTYETLNPLPSKIRKVFQEEYQCKMCNIVWFKHIKQQLQSSNETGTPPPEI